MRMRVCDMLCAEADMAQWPGLDFLAEAALADANRISDRGHKIVRTLLAAKQGADVPLPAVHALHIRSAHSRVPACVLPSPASFSSTDSRAGNKESGDVSPSVKAKRKRANASQLAALREAFVDSPFPNAEARRVLARRLAMTPRSVQIWFQNQRQIARHNAR